MSRDQLQDLPFYDPLRPVAPQARWWIVGAVVVLLGAWELLFHLTMMGLPIVTGHRLNALVAAALVSGTVLGCFIVVQRYEQQLAAAAVALRQKNEALRALEAERDTRLVDLARDLALILGDITTQCHVALSLSVPGTDRKTLQAVKERAEELPAVVRSLIELREDGAGLTEFLPAVLETYERYRETRPPGPGSAPEGGGVPRGIRPPEDRPVGAPSSAPNSPPEPAHTREVHVSKAVRATARSLGNAFRHENADTLR
jgi:hypothetical protein